LSEDGLGDCGLGVNVKTNTAKNCQLYTLVVTSLTLVGHSKFLRVFIFEATCYRFEEFEFEVPST
jgi:hypothetical protein